MIVVRSVKGSASVLGTSHCPFPSYGPTEGDRAKGQYILLNNNSLMTSNIDIYESVGRLNPLKARKLTEMCVIHNKKISKNPTYRDVCHL